MSYHSFQQVSVHELLSGAWPKDLTGMPTVGPNTIAFLANPTNTPSSSTTANSPEQKCPNVMAALATWHRTKWWVQATIREATKDSEKSRTKVFTRFGGLAEVHSFNN